MKTEDRESIRARHVVARPAGERCYACRQPAPCDAIQALDAYESLLRDHYHLADISTGIGGRLMVLRFALQEIHDEPYVCSDFPDCDDEDCESSYRTFLIARLALGWK